MVVIGLFFRLRGLWGERLFYLDFMHDFREGLLQCDDVFEQHAKVRDTQRRGTGGGRPIE